jgi:hypothetical protein
VTDHTANDPEADNFKNDGFTHTSWVIPERDFKFDEHEWEQRGTELICTSCKQQHAVTITVDKMLIKEEGKYKIVPVPVLA